MFAMKEQRASVPATRFWRPLLMASVVVMAPLLFLGGPDYYSPRSVALGWQLGHPLLFFMLVLLAWGPLSARVVRPWFTLALIALLAALVVGVLIEWLQHFVGRQSSWQDVRLDMLGAALGVGWAGHRMADQRAWMPRATLLTAVSILLYADVRPLAVAVVDEWHMRRSFPVLADFSTPFELGRWESSSPISVVPAPGESGTGARALKVELQPAAYAGLTLRYFEEDWSGFRVFYLRFFNPAPETVKITCRINDRQHETDNRFSDRYNHSVALEPGWNDILIPLYEVRRAPQGREMDMRQVTGMMCFVARLAVDRVLLVGGAGLG